ncbi:ATP-binding protein [Pseudidiomarina sp. 1APP75-32.1]|uniref:ATP-binding protein n=1 Tax=Pseudidiomarina terrestris TaxID=2820060 RepID=A0AAW7R2S1_9GAMM|nr:ATP-binding protein [Pseudidiomarina sp. 1APP75-32.1]MDN7125056.1 ATP-binding protein [Pseudidiomarina sp. 1APP75-32.1]
MQFVNRNDLIRWLDNIADINAVGRGWSPDFWKPFHFVTLAARARRESAGLKINNQQLDYAVRMGLFEAIGQTPPYSVFRRPANGRFVEARTVQSEGEVARVAQELSQMFRCENESSEEALGVLFSELLGNCISHSTAGESEPFGLICGQTWPNGNKAQFCLADTGIGIRESLMENSNLAERLSNENACAVATEYGVTGKPLGHHSGYGLALTNDLVSKNNGRLFVVSGQELYCNRGGDIQVSELNNGWDGCAVIFEWQLDTNMDVEEVYNSWPAPDGMEEDDYDELFN